MTTDLDKQQGNGKAADTNPTTNNESSEKNVEKSSKQNHHGVKGEAEKAKDKVSNKKEKIKDKNNPAGGYDDTPIPGARDGYIVKFTFHRAENLPVADFGARSSDPYIHATLTSRGLQKRHKEDPDLTLRTRTIHKSVAPQFGTEWIVAGIPSEGFRLKCRLYDEDPSDHDDRLGNVTVTVGQMGENWEGIKDERFDIKKRVGSKRAYSVKAIVACCSQEVSMDGKLYLSAEVLGKSDPPYGRMYTVGPLAWTKHQSPMIGRLVGIKSPGEDGDGNEDEQKPQKYNFQANEFQLQGPIPPHLYHRFVEFKPFVKGMFTKMGPRGYVLNKALHHQHARVYNYSATTEYGLVEPCSDDAAVRFLKLAHFDEGGRIFTYVLTLDALFRFTETGKEFGVDLLSKHTMHSDVNIYIACSGEFFIRRLKNKKKPVNAPDQQTHPNTDLPGGPPHAPPPKDPADYELVIDNDSGTYRPNGKYLPELRDFLHKNFPGLKVVTMECDDEKLAKMKDEQRERKKQEGQAITVIQNSDDEISSSDEEDFDKRQKGGKTGKQRAYEALEDPSQAAKDLMPGHHGESSKQQA